MPVSSRTCCTKNTQDFQGILFEADFCIEMESEIFLPSTVIKSQKGKCMLPFLWNIDNNTSMYTSKYTCGYSATCSQRERLYVRS